MSAPCSPPEKPRGDVVHALVALWVGLPPTLKEPIREVMKVIGNSILVIGATLYSFASVTPVPGHPAERYTDTAQLFFGYCFQAWWGVCVGLAYPMATRVREGYLRGLNTAALPNGQQVVITAETAPPSVRRLDPEA